MKYALPVVAVAVLFLWTLSTRRRLTVLGEDVDQALTQFNAQQFCRINALAALVDLTNAYAPGAVWVRSDVIQSCCGMISSASSLKDIGKKELIMSQILTQIMQAVQLHPELRSDARYFKCMSELSLYENLSRAHRLLYNGSVNRLNRELRLFPASVMGRVLGFQEREPIGCPQGETPLYRIFPAALPCSACTEERAPPDNQSEQRPPDTQEHLRLRGPSISFPYTENI